MKLTGGLGSRFKTMIMKCTDSPSERSESESAPPPPPSAPIFDLAPGSLDLAKQALQNIESFKSYLEIPQADGRKYFPAVGQSFSGGLTWLRNRTADRASQLAEAKTAASDFEGQELRNRALEEEYRRELEALEREEASLRAELEDLRRAGAGIEAEIATGKALKKSVRTGFDDFTSLSARLSALEADFVRETATAAATFSELNELKMQAESQRQQLDLALSSCQSRVRELTFRARRADVDSAQAKGAAKRKKLEPLLLTPDVSAFVIDDRVRISIEDAEKLRFMIEALEKENEELTEVQNDKMADIDCLGQENLGLKQLIRQLTQG
jgi:chromosome segregation ATPase